jgi:hypothetical protein
VLVGQRPRTASFWAATSENASACFLRESAVLRRRGLSGRHSD